MESATKRMEVIYRERVDPGGRRTAGLLVGSLKPMGFATVRAIRGRPNQEEETKTAKEESLNSEETRRT